MEALERERVEYFPSRPALADVARFQYFRNGPGRKFGVWVVRQDHLHFALPFVTGLKAATSDYEPFPHGFPGVAAPVEKIYPCLVPFLQLDDGKIIAASDGADEIKTSVDRKSVTAVWRRWVIPGNKAGDVVDAGLVSEVTWSLHGNRLRRVESLTSSQPLNVQRLWLAIPSRYDHLETSYLQGGARIDRLISEEKILEIQVKNSDWLLEISAYATGNDPLGRGDRGPLPLYLILQTKSFSLTPAVPKHWELSLTTQ